MKGSPGPSKDVFGGPNSTLRRYDWKTRGMILMKRRHVFFRTDKNDLATSLCLKSFQPGYFFLACDFKFSGFQSSTIA